MSYDIDSLRSEIRRLRAGEDLTPRDEATWPTPGQAWHELLDATEAERLARLGRLIDLASRATYPRLTKEPR